MCLRTGREAKDVGSHRRGARCTSPVSRARGGARGPRRDSIKTSHNLSTPAHCHTCGYAHGQPTASSKSRFQAWSRGSRCTRCARNRCPLLLWLLSTPRLISSQASRLDAQEATAAQALSTCARDVSHTRARTCARTHRRSRNRAKLIDLRCVAWEAARDTHEPLRTEAAARLSHCQLSNDARVELAPKVLNLCCLVPADLVPLPIRHDHERVPQLPQVSMLQQRGARGRPACQEVRRPCQVEPASCADEGVSK